MAVIKLKNSTTTAAPAQDTLQVAEPAYSFVSDKLFLGYSDGTGGTDPIAVGGALYVAMMDHTAGILTADSAILVDSNKHIDELIAGGLTLTTSGGAGQQVTAITTNLDTLGGGSALSTELATAAAIKTYVDTNISEVTIDDLDDVTFLTSPVAGQVIIYNATSGEWENKTLSGDVTLGANGTTNITASGVTTGSYGSSTQIPTFTVAADGRLTAAGSVDVATTLTLGADSGTGDGVDLLVDTLTVTGTNGLNTSLAGDTITVGIDDLGIVNAKLANNSVSTTKIVDGNVTNAKLATDSVTTIKIVDENVTNAKLATDSVSTIKIVDENVTEEKLATDSVSTVKILNGNVTNAKLAADSVSTAKIVDENVTNAKLASDSVSTAKIVDSNVTNAKLENPGFTISDAEGIPETDFVNLGETLQFVGGTGLTSAVTNNVVTFTLDNQITAGSVGSSTQIPVITFNAQGQITATTTASIATTLSIAADEDDLVLPPDGTDLLTETFTLTGGTGIQTLAKAGTSGDEIVVTLSDTTVTAGSYGSQTKIPVLTVDAQGRLTTVSTVDVATTLSILADSGTGDGVDLLNDDLTIAGGTGIETSISGDTLSVTLSDQITAGSIGSSTQIPVITFNNQGQITSTTTASLATDLTVIGDAGNSTTIELLTEGLTIAGGTALTSSVDDGSAPNIITIDLDNTAVTPGSYGSASKVASFTVDQQGRLTAAGEVDIATTLKISADGGIADDEVANGTVALAGDTLAFNGGVGLTTTLADNSITVDLDNTAVTAGTYGSSTSTQVTVPQFTVDAQGRITSATNLAVDATSFSTIAINDTDSGFSWAETGNIQANTNQSTLQFVSGYGINVDVDSSADAIRITNTGVTTVTAGDHLTVSAASGDITLDTDAESSNIVNALVVRDGSGDFAANKVTLNELQVDDININGNIITSTATNANIQLTPNGAGIVEITKGLDVSGNVTIAGDLTVTGTTTTIDVTELSISDPMIYLAGDSTSDVVDIGFVGSRDPSGDGSEYTHLGLVRHAADNQFYLFHSYDPEPANTNIIDPTHASFEIATLNANVIGDIEGNADSATILETARTIALSGDVVGSVSFNGSQDVTITTTIQPNSVVLGTDTTGNYVATLANSDGSLTITNSGTETAAVGIELDVTSNHFVEGAQDAVGAAIGNGTHTNVSITYDDNLNAINSSVATGTRSTLGVVKFGYVNPDIYAADGTTIIQSGGYQFGLDGAGNIQLQEIDGGTF